MPLHPAPGFQAAGRWAAASILTCRFEWIDMGVCNASGYGSYEINLCGLRMGLCDTAGQ